MKRIIAAALAALMLFAFASCGTEPKDTGVTTTTTTVKGNTDTTPTPTDRTVDIKVLGGPTGMGISKLWNDSKNGNTALKYNFSVTASPDAEYLADIKKGEFDIAALPTNVAAKLYNTGAPIQIAAVNTLGVLYVLEAADTPTIKSVADLKGKTIYTTGQGATPEYALRYILSSNGIDPDNDVNIIYETDGSLVIADIKKGDASVVMLPEPAATNVQKVTNAKVVLDVTEEWNKIAGEGNDLMQGCVVVSNKFVSEHKDLLDTFLAEYDASVKYVNENQSEAAQMIVDLQILSVSAEVAQTAINGSKITYVDGDAMKTALLKVYEVLFNADNASIGGKIPDENIFYKK